MQLGMSALCQNCRSSRDSSCGHPGENLRNPHELLCKRVSQGRISKAPTNCPTSIISATVTALRGYSVPRVKIIHCCQLGPEAARRHRYVHEVREILFDLFGCPTGSMAVHVFSLIKKRDLVIDVNSNERQANLRVLHKHDGAISD